MLTVYSKNMCPHCDSAKKYLASNGIEYQEVKIDEDADAREFVVGQGHRSVPQIYQGDKLFVEGGWQGLSKLSGEEIKSRLGLTENLGTL